VDDGMQVDNDLAAHPVDVVATFAPQRPRHRRECTRVRLFAVVLVGADVAVLAKRTPHVTGSEEDRARAFRAAVEQLLTGVMEMRANPRSRGEFAGAELGARRAVDTAIPRTEIAVGKHAVGQLATQVQQARSLRSVRQQRARPDRLPASKKYRGQTVELGPERVLAGCYRIDLCSKRCGNTNFGRPSVLRPVKVPRQAIADRRTPQIFKMRQVANAAAPCR